MDTASRAKKSAGRRETEGGHCQGVIVVLHGAQNGFRRLVCIGPEAEELKNNLKEGQALLLENLRFHKGEETNNKEFSEDLTLGIDYFVNDAFSCSHRKHSSTVGVTSFLPSFMGTHLEKEINALESVLNNPNKPVAAIIGGSKVSTKIDVINSLLKKMDIIIIGGAMANTFVAAKGLDVGKSLFEKNCLDLARELIEISQNNNCKLILPIDFIVSKIFKKKCSKYKYEF